MPDPITLSGIGAVALTEGIKFFYSQAGEVLKRWREHRKVPSEAGNKTIPITATPPSIFEGKLAPLEIHLDMVKPLEEHLLKLRASLTNYNDGMKDVDPSDQLLLETIDALRQVMEAIYKQRLTFRREPRAASGPVVEGTIDVKSIAGRAVGVEAKIIESGIISGIVKAERLEETGIIKGVKLEKLGK
jgi:exonuclease VII small subunit